MLFRSIAEVDPDVVVVASCGFDLEGTAGHAADVLERLPARAAVWAVDANAVMVRPGPRLVDGVESAGRYEVRWNGRNDAGLELGTGIYFYRLKAGSFVDVRKMLLMK